MLTKYLLAVFVVVLISLVKYFVPGLGNDAPTLLYLFGIFVVANLLGYFPSLLATALSGAAANFLFQAPHLTFTSGNAGISAALVLVLEGFVVSWLVEKTKGVNHELLKSQTELRQSNERVISIMEELLEKDGGAYRAMPRRKER